MTIELLPLPLPTSADPFRFVDFGREVMGVNLGSLECEQFEEILEALYKVCVFGLDLDIWRSLFPYF